MNSVTIGDLAQHFMLQNRTASVKQNMLRANEELVTGQVTEVASHLGGNVRELSAIQHRMTMLDGFGLASREAASFTGAAQIHLEKMTDLSQDLVASSIRFDASPTQAGLRSFSDQALAALHETVSTLNATYADRAIFAGAATDVAPIASADDILSALRLQVSGAQTADDVYAQVSDWFEDPAGFAATHYFGSNDEKVVFPLSSKRSVSFDVTANSSELKTLLRDLSVAALIPDLDSQMPFGEQSRLATQSGHSAQTSTDQLIDVAANLGFVQEQIDRLEVRQAAEKSALELANADLIGRDSFEAATELESIQTQLETVYAVTARSAQLNLLAFLR